MSLIWTILIGIEKLLSWINSNPILKAKRDSKTWAKVKLFQSLKITSSLVSSASHTSKNKSSKCQKRFKFVDLKAVSTLFLTISDKLSLGPHFNDSESSCIDLNEYDCDKHIEQINHPGLVKNVEVDSDLLSMGDNTKLLQTPKM